MILLRKIFLLGVLVLLPLSVRAQTNIIFSITNAWRYNQTSNLDGTTWKLPAYDDSGWPSGPALLYVESSTAVAPRNTLLTLGRITYYFRTRFTFSGDPATSVLTFSNKIDDGAVFYLNGTEIQRVRMPAAPAVITYTNLATGQPTGGSATDWEVFSVRGTNLVVGTNVLAVEVHQVTSGSSDIVFGSALSSSLLETNLVRGPYLQLMTPTNVVIRWRTDFTTDGIVRFGTNLANLDRMVGPITGTNEFEVFVGNLTPETKYFYSIGTSSKTLAGGDTNHFFVTSPIPGTIKPTRIWVIGDAGTADANQRAVRDAYYNFTGNRHTDLWLMLGDNAYDDGTDAEYQAAVFDMYPTLLRNSPTWPALGNHDTDQATTFTNTYPYFSMFTLPTNGMAGGMASGTEHYYSFDYANIHFVCLDSMTASRATNGAMADWLIDDLDSTTNTWIIAYWHHPPYSKGSHDSDSASETHLIQMRERFLPILEERGVDLVLGGHSHAYERSFFLDGHYSYSSNLTASMKLNAGSGRTNSATGVYTKTATDLIAHQGAVYIVAGSSGKISGGALNHPAMFISTNILGSLVLDISGNRLDATFLRSTNAAADTFTILKEDVRFTAIQPIASNSMKLSLTNVATGKTNIIQASTTLTNWLSLSTNKVGTNWFEFTDVNATNFGHRFYRVLRLP